MRQSTVLKIAEALVWDRDVVRALEVSQEAGTPDAVIRALDPHVPSSMGGSETYAGYSILEALMEAFDRRAGTACDVNGIRRAVV